MPNTSNALITTPIKAGYYFMKNPRMLQAATGIALMTGTISFPTAVAVVSYFSNADITLKIAASTLPVLYSASSNFLPKILKSASSNSPSSMTNKKYEVEEIDDFVLIHDKDEESTRHDEAQSKIIRDQ